MNQARAYEIKHGGDNDAETLSASKENMLSRVLFVMLLIILGCLDQHMHITNLSQDIKSMV